MDEVDKIIISSLRQIGCGIDDGIVSMSSFTPELLVHAVSSCLHEINTNATLPRALPTNMAQRFSVATILADAVSTCGYRSDIGYQTFLYPNAVDVRRLLMFLIEQLPKESQSENEPINTGPMGAYQVLERKIKEKIKTQLQMPWVPQYCRVVGNRRQLGGCSSQNIKFAPQLNLNIPGTQERTKEVQNYLQQQAPSVFQQTAATEFDLISTVMHKNSLDLHSSPHETLKKLKDPISVTSITSTKLPASSTTTKLSPEEKSLAIAHSPLEILNMDVNMLKCQTETLLAERKSTIAMLQALKQQLVNVAGRLDQLHKDLKVHERTCVVLENPTENITKLEGLIQTAQERRQTLEQQWQAYRQPMEQQLQTLQSAKQAKKLQNVMDLRLLITELEAALREKTATHSQLSAELKKATSIAAPRKEYTQRILEFIGNIRKQRNDIFKVLDDTRDLQKQLNSVSAQLQRQFNYTDDLLFQSAKHDLHAKKAYKLLATLHATCNELVELVSQTGNITKEIRDVEVQLDHEKLKNITNNLDQITTDIRNFENVIKNIQSEIRKVENEITVA